MGTTDTLCSYRAVLSLQQSYNSYLYDEKFVNSNELTTVEPIDDITIHMETPEIKDKLLVGQCIAVALISQHHALRAIKFNQLML